MATKFALHQLDVLMPDGVTITFWFDGNSKVTRDNGAFEKPAANAFSLVQIKDCPFATEMCKNVCYVNKLEKKELEVYAKYQINSEAIRRVLDDPEYLKTTIKAFADYISKYCAGGFRWHVSGDVFSRGYAMFICNVCWLSEDVNHWIYTRSFEYLWPLSRASNLTVNLSADEDNWVKAEQAARIWGFRLCYLTLDGTFPDLPDDSVIFPHYDLRARDPVNDDAAGWLWFNFVLSSRERRMVCPADYFGQSERFRCGVCKKCLKPFKS